MRDKDVKPQVTLLRIEATGIDYTEPSETKVQVRFVGNQDACVWLVRMLERYKLSEKEIDVGVLSDIDT